MQTSLKIIMYLNLFFSLVFVMSCIFLWFCVMIYPYRRRQNLKALVRVKNYVNEGSSNHQVGNSNKMNDLENEKNVDENSNNKVIINKNEISETRTAHIEDRVLYDQLKEVNVSHTSPFSVFQETPSNNLQKSNCDKRYDEKQVFSEEKLQISEGKNNLENAKSAIFYDLASNQLKSDFINSSDEQDSGLQKASPINTKGINFMNGVIAASKSNQSKISFMNKKDATLRLEISNEMLNPASSHSVKKIRREAVVEAPIMTTHF